MEKYNTLWSRFWALNIDGLIMFPVGILISYLSPFITTPKFALLFSSAVNLILVFYYILMHFRYGQTLGKMVMKVKVLDITENQITFTQAVIRSLPDMFPVFAGAGIINSVANPNPDQDFIQYIYIFLSAASWIWHVADIIVCLASEKKRALHDFIAGTVVVKTNSDSISITP